MSFTWIWPLDGLAVPLVGAEPAEEPDEVDDEDGVDDLSVLDLRLEGGGWRILKSGA